MNVRSQGVCRAVAVNDALDSVHYHLSPKPQTHRSEYILNFAVAEIRMCCGLTSFVPARRLAGSFGSFARFRWWTLNWRISCPLNIFPGAHRCYGSLH